MRRADGSTGRDPPERGVRARRHAGGRRQRLGERAGRRERVAQVRHPRGAETTPAWTACSHCGGDLPAERRLLSLVWAAHRCAAHEPRDVPIDVQHAKPRYFGLGPPVFVLLARASPARPRRRPARAGLGRRPGVIAIALAVCLLPTFLAGARRWPDTPDRARGHQHRRPRARRGRRRRHVDLDVVAGRPRRRCGSARSSSGSAASGTRRSASWAGRSSRRTAVRTS